MQTCQPSALLQPKIFLITKYRLFMPPFYCQIVPLHDMVYS